MTVVRTDRPTKVPGFPKTPANVDPQMRQFLEAIVEALDIRLGRKGDPTDRAITLRELIESGLAKRLKASPYDPNNFGNSSLGFEGPIPIGAFPTAPTGVLVEAAYSQINIFFDVPYYLGHAQTEIWSHTSDVLGDATLAGVTIGRSFVDLVGSGVTRYYWLRHVNSNGVHGPWNASAGILGETAPDVDHLLDVLSGSITSSELATSLTTKLDGFEDDIADLETTFGSTASAAASAAAALAAKAAALLAQAGAETAEDNAVIAKTAAQTAESNASTSETAASSSATGAAGSASNAATSATAAANSATAAGNSASAANTSATTASSQATAAGQSASAASVSQTAASTSEGNAANSASAAATSATTASASETAAGQSATIASGHANTASTKAGQASTFASNAATSATNAAGSASSAASTVNGLTARLNDVNDTGSGSAVTVEQAYSATATNSGDITSLQGQYTVKIDANGAVAGFGLASTSTSLGTNESEFYVNADRFAIMRGGSDTTAAVAPFVVQATPTTINGQTVPAGVYMDAAFIKNASITSAKIGSVNANSINAGSLNANFISGGTIDASQVNIAGVGTGLNISSASTGSRMAIASDHIKIFDGNTLRVQLGNLSA